MNKIKYFFNNNIMILAILFFSGAFIAGKFAVAEFPPIPLTFFRFAFATPILFGILIFQKKTAIIPFKEIPIVIFLSITGMIGYHIFFFSALKYTTSTNAALINSMIPVLTSIFAGIFLKETFNLRTASSVLLSFFGVLFLITDGSMEAFLNFSFNLGDLFMFIAVISFSIYFVILKNVLKRIDPLTLVTYIFFFCAILLCPFLYRYIQLSPYSGPESFLAATTWKGWLSILYMSVFASVLGYLIQQISIKKIGIIKTSLYINLNPIFSMILAYIILGEKISLNKIIAALIILLGVILTVKNKTHS